MSGTRYELTEYISPDGATYSFDTGDHFLMTEEGLGMPDIKYITTKGPIQNGETYLGFRLEPRIIQYVHRVNSCSRTNFWANRTAILSMLRPNRQSINAFDPGTLRKIFFDGTIRDIDVFLSEGPKFGPRDLAVWDEWAYTETIRFVAPDPTFYDPTLRSATVSYSTAQYLIFPITFYNRVTGPTARNLLFTADLIETATNCTTSGNWITYPTITIAGPAYGIRIENTTTGEKLQINYNLPAGQTIIVDLKFGNKRVYVSQTGQNILSTLSTDSDLATFHLEPAPGAAGGVNVVRIYASNVSVGTTAFTVSWYDRYIGI